MINLVFYFLRIMIWIRKLLEDRNRNFETFKNLQSEEKYFSMAITFYYFMILNHITK